MISKEEYEILKDLGERWEWMARDSGSNRVGNLFAYSGKPFKYDVGLWDCGRGIHRIDNHLFQFIKWEDDEPHNIAELIEEYEDESEEREQKFYVLNSEGEAIPYDDLVQSIQWEDEEPYNIAELIKEYESEETEVKNIEELKSWLEGDKLYMGEHVKRKINQLDEPEVLSQEWIDGKKLRVSRRIPFHMDVEYAVPEEDLQNLLVPKQEEVNRAYKDGYEKGKQHTFYKGYLEGITDKDSEPETVADVLITFWKSYERLKEAMSMEVEELEE